MKQLKKFKILNALNLKIIAMVLMLIDHLWATVVAGGQWMTNLGRLAFPIFAFQIAEGYFKTHDFKKYLSRLFLFALISEIPFNLMMEGSLINPFHQNVLFTFCIALCFMRLIDRAKKLSRPLWYLAAAGYCLPAFLAGTLTMCDYFGFGVLTVLVFYFFHEGRFAWLGQLGGMILIHYFMMEGLTLNFTLMGHLIEFPQQALAVFALIPIWMYNHKQGPHSKAIQYACYAFYPVHILILSLISLAV